jgi:hypothetical protein
MAQEHQLLQTWAQSPHLSQRYFAAYCNWTQTLERGDRRSCLEGVDRTICLIETGHIPRASSWARQAECLFVLSPEGVGMDCHRTWEALMLGCIPIVRRSPICELFGELPVLIVEDWADVRRDVLEAYVRDLGARIFDFSTVLRDTWVRRIHGLDPHPPLKLTHADFRRVMTRTTA